MEEIFYIFLFRFWLILWLLRLAIFFKNVLSLFPLHEEILRGILIFLLTKEVTCWRLVFFFKNVYLRRPLFARSRLWDTFWDIFRSKYAELFFIIFWLIKNIELRIIVCLESVLVLFLCFWLREEIKFLLIWWFPKKIQSLILFFYFSLNLGFFFVVRI